MKSKEEFIAGIYEKAANYAEEEKKTKAYAWKTAALRIAAAVVFCVGLAGIGAAALWHGNGTKQPEGDIALFSAVSEGDDQSSNPVDYSVNHPEIPLENFRMLPEQKEIQLTGVIESIDETERILWVFLESWGETEESLETEPEMGTLAAIAWGIPEEFPAKLSVGTKLMAAGEAGIYGGVKSERYGMAQLTLTDMAKLWIWMEEEHTYKDYNNEGQE